MNPQDYTTKLEYSRDNWGHARKAIVTATDTKTGTNFVAVDDTPHKARLAAVEGLAKLLENSCMGCGAEATLVNHTQFAGTHYWCDACVPPEDLIECTTLVCRSPYCECTPGECKEGRIDKRGEQPLSQPTPDPKPADAHQNYTKVQYLLDKLQEEAAEVIQAISKIRRFGPHNHHPERQETNLQELTGELEDFQAIVWALEELQYFDPKPSTISTIRKFNTLMSN